jgi:hypothetical protein
VAIDSPVDDVYGDLDGQGDCDVTPAVVLMPSGTYSCTFSGAVSGNAGLSHTDTATASGVDDDGNPVSAFADADVTITDASSTTTTTTTIASTTTVAAPTITAAPTTTAVPPAAPAVGRCRPQATAEIRPALTSPSA